MQKCGEQDGRGVGGRGIHHSPQTHQEYTFRHRSACRTPAESRQEYLTSRKKYIDPRKTEDQALSLWSGSTDSKTLDYQRTNPREYQIVRIHRNKTTSIQDPASPNHLHPVQDSASNLNNKENKNTSQIISRQNNHLTQPYPSEEKQTNKNSVQVSPYTKLTQTTRPYEDRSKKEERVQT